MISRFATLVVIAIVLLAPFRLEAQGEFFRDAWRWATFDRGSGLGDASVNTVTTDASGVNWLGVDGVLYFDGWEWRSVRGAPAGHVLIFPRSRGGIYAVSDASAYVGDTTGVRPITAELRNANGKITSGAVVHDALVVLAAGADGHRLWQVDAAGGARRLVPPVPDSLLRGDSRLWQGSKETAILVALNGVYRWDGVRWTTMVAWANGTRARLLAEQSDGAGMLVVSQGDPKPGVWEWRPGATPTWRPQPTDAQVAAIAVDSSGTWIQWFFDGKYRARAPGGEWSAISRVPHATGRVSAIHFDRTGNLWLAGRSVLNVYRRSSTRWTELADSAPSPFDRVNVIAPMPDGTFWLGTTGGVLVVDTANGLRTLRRIRDASGTRLGTLTAVTRDTAGGVWVASGAEIEGAYRWDGRSWRHFGPADGLSAQRVHDIVVDRVGTVWLLSIGRWGDFAGGGGAFAWDGKRFTHWGTSEGLPHQRVYAFADGADGSRWFGTGGGLSRWKDGKWTHWASRPATPGETPAQMPFRVFTLTLDRAGRPWFGDQINDRSAYGIATIDASDSVRLLAPRGARAHEQIFKLAFDSAGNLWATTPHALAVVRDGEWYEYGEQFGVRPIPWPLLVGRDRLFVGTVAGLQSLDLRASMSNPPPRVTVETAVAGDDNIVARWSVHAWNGSTDPGQIKTRYRLDGGPWSPWSAERELHLVGAAAGTHTIEVEPRVGFASTEPAVAVATIRVPFPIYRRPQLLIPAAALLLVITVVGFRTRQRSRRAERELRESEQRSLVLAEASFDGIAMTRGDRIVDANDQLAAMLGVSKSALLGRDIWEFVPADEAERVRHRRVREAGQTYSSWVRRADGTVFPVEVRGRDLVVRGKLLRVTTLRDLSAQRALEARVAQRHKLEAIGQLAGGIAHDFNNILTGILGSAELATLELQRPAALARRLDDIQAAGQRATDLIRQILTFSRPRQPTRAVVTLPPLVSEVARLLRATIPAGVVIEETVRGPVPKIELAPFWWTRE